MPRKRTARSAKPSSPTEDEKTQFISAATEVTQAARASNKMLGVFCSASGGPHQAIQRAVSVGGRSVSFFIKNRRRWESPPFTSAQIDKWFETIEKTNFPLDQVVPHGTYFLNPGSPEFAIRERSRDNMLDDCRRCEALGISLYCFHPGSTLGICTVQESMAKVADTINYIIKRTKFVILLIETMAGSGYTIGGTFGELRSIIDKVQNKKRVGVCVDTCHLFATGHDIRTQTGYDNMMRRFDQIIGLRYLKAVHMNDSKREFNSMVDRHANIGHGQMGMQTFAHIMNDRRLDGIPMVLETPGIGTYINELLDLYALERTYSRRRRGRSTSTPGSSSQSTPRRRRRASSTASSSSDSGLGESESETDSSESDGTTTNA